MAQVCFINRVEIDALAGNHQVQAEKDQYGALEKPITDVRNMAAIVAQMMEKEGGIETGDVTINAQSWETFSFAVYHLQELVSRLHMQYFRDCEVDASTSS